MTVEINASEARGGSGIFRYHDVGLNPFIRVMITEIIITQRQYGQLMAAADRRFYKGTPCPHFRGVPTRWLRTL